MFYWDGRHLFQREDKDGLSRAWALTCVGTGKLGLVDKRGEATGISAPE